MSARIHIDHASYMRLRSALVECDGFVAVTARQLGLDRATCYRRLERAGLRAATGWRGGARRHRGGR
jgi:transcriptional regulator of acetoin/glycerol metabolism